MTLILKRKILFWTLVFLFVITAPTVVFYVLGYRFNLQKGIFIHTGSITIKSNPQDVQIYLNNKAIKSKFTNKINNTIHINGIRPGEYLLKISAPDYSEWSKKIIVKSGISTEFWNVLLTRKNYEIIRHETPNIQRFFPVPEKKLASYVQKKEHGFSVGIINLDSFEKKIIFSIADYEFTNDEKENIEWSPREKRIIIPALKEGVKNYFIVDIETEEVLNLNNLINEKEIQSVRWDPDNRDYIFYISAKNLYRLNLENPKNVKIIAQNISSYDIAADKIYYFHLHGGIVYQSDLENKENPVQITTSPPDKFSADQNYKIIAYDEKRIILFNSSGNAHIFNKGEHQTYFKKIESSINNAQFSDDGKKLLLWNDWEIFIYFTRDWNVQPFRKENELINITRFAQPLKNIQWIKDYEHVAFSVGNLMKSIEIDNRAQKNTMLLTKLKNNSPLIISDYKNNRIYFIDKDEKEITDLYSFEFPEKTELF